MDFSLTQAVGFITSIIVIVLCIFALGNYLSQESNQIDDHLVKDNDFESNDIFNSFEGRTVPTLEIEEIHLELGKPVTLNELKRYVKANDTVEGDISDKVVVNGKLDFNQAGIYSIKFTVENNVGLKKSYIKNVLVD